MTKKILLLAICSLLLVLGFSAHAQQPAKIPRIGIVTGTAKDPTSTKKFRQALQDLGYVEGKNILFEHRYTEGNRDRVAGIVAELLSLKVNILFSTQAIVVRAAKQATKTIPIVMAITPDPVALGLVDSLAHPGGNITGLTSLARQLSGKRLELLNEMIPKLSRVGIILVTGSSAFKDYEDAGLRGCEKISNRDSSCTGAKRGQCFRKSPLSHCATAPHRVQRREVVWRGALNGVLRPRATVPAVLRRLGERHRPHQIVGERVPQCHCFYLIEPAHQKLCEPTPARDGVNTFGGGGALLVNLLGHFTAHALAPLDNRLAVIGQRHMGITAGDSGVAHRSILRGATSVGIFNVSVAG
jgi:hypothetical protein